MMKQLPNIPQDLSKYQFLYAQKLQFKGEKNFAKGHTAGLPESDSDPRPVSGLRQSLCSVYYTVLLFCIKSFPAYLANLIMFLPISIVSYIFFGPFIFSIYVVLTVYCVIYSGLIQVGVFIIMNLFSLFTNTQNLVPKILCFDFSNRGWGC